MKSLAYKARTLGPFTLYCILLGYAPFSAVSVKCQYTYSNLLLGQAWNFSRACHLRITPCMLIPAIVPQHIANVREPQLSDSNQFLDIEKGNLPSRVVSPLGRNSR